MRQAGQFVNHDEGADQFLIMPVTRRSTSAVPAIGELQVSGLGMVGRHRRLPTGDPARLWVSPNQALPARRWSGAAHDGGNCRSARATSILPSVSAGAVSLPRRIQFETAVGFTPTRAAYSDFGKGYGFHGLISQGFTPLTLGMVPPDSPP